MVARFTASVLGAFIVLVEAFAASTPARADPPGDAANWNLIFEDNFEGDSLDLGKWATCYWWNEGGCTNASNSELQWYLPGNIQVAGGKLDLTARRETAVGDNRFFPYTSGLVTTGPESYAGSYPKFEYKYGYAEIRARLPAGRGIWPAFWMLPSRDAPVPEIDIMEMIGQDPDTVAFAIHYFDFLRRTRSKGHAYTSATLETGWHVFAADWSPDQIVWYVDGVERWRFDDSRKIPDVPMYLLLNLAVGGTWAGPPDAATYFPAVMSVDYVRVWQKHTQ